MANISKNIKRIRTAKKLTQEQLAEKLNVTRQTVSSWENDRTQPDIDMLTALSGALETDIEDLIYGKKKHVGLEADPADKRRTLSLVLAIMGSLLTAVGLILLYVYYWNRLPDAVRSAFALLPAAAGAGAGIAVLCLKKRSVPLREGAAVLWCVGLIASNALVNSLFAVDFGFERLLLADVLLLLPVMFLLDSVFAFSLETGLSVLLIAYDLEESPWYALAAGLAALAACLVYVFANRQPANVKKYCAWLGLIGVCAAVPFAVARFADMQTGMLGFAMPYIFFLALYIAGEEPHFGLRLRRPAAIVLGLGLLLAVLLSRSGDLGLPACGLELWLLLAWGALCLVPAVLRGRGTFRGEPFRILLACVFAAYLIPLAAVGEMAVTGAVFFSLAVGALAVAAGIRKGSLSTANLGMLHIAANIFMLLASMEDVDFVWIGVTFVVLGIVFLAANKLMVKKFGARAAARASGEKEEAADEGLNG